MRGERNIVNSLPNNKILNWSKLKVFAEDRLNVNQILNFTPLLNDNISDFTNL